MSKKKFKKKVLILGSGPIIIGQAAEFDYSGTQACMALKEEGYEVILVNPNPATIMTDKKVADKIYMEPLEYNFVKWIIGKEKPDAILPTFGGQTTLNLVVELYKKNVLKKYKTETLGTSLDSIIMSEDRDLFAKKIAEINEQTLPYLKVKDFSDVNEYVKAFGFPIVVRPSFTLAGTGGGIAKNYQELKIILENALSQSKFQECIIEKSIYGYKEIEFEVVRDHNGSTIAVCSLENIDPCGIHTGDSMVVCPVLTLSNAQLQALRTSAIKIANHLNIIGGCNVQFAFCAEKNDYFIIEVNPRVSRSSALASKASGYPIAFVCAKIASGKTLSEICINKTNKNIKASFEPSLDYIVVKIPKFPFDKFKQKNYHISTQMQSTGEVMAIGRSFTEAFLKGIRSIIYNTEFIWQKNLKNEKTTKLLGLIKNANGYWFYQIYELIRREVSLNQLSKITKIDPFFIYQWKKIFLTEKLLKENKNCLKTLRYAKKIGFSDFGIAKIWDTSEKEIFKIREKNNIFPVYKNIDSSSAEFFSLSNYLFSTYSEKNDSVVSDKKKVLIVGSGAISIGQGIEFDFSTVHCSFACKKSNYETIILNCNPETVSTDSMISDKLYFDPITYEDFKNLIHLEKPDKIILQCGGQTAINLVTKIKDDHLNISGTSIESFDISENRTKFAKLMKKLKINFPKHFLCKNEEELFENAKKLNYCLLFRPSYVIGGKNMEIITSIEELKLKLKTTKFDYPVYIDKFIDGIEVEIDAAVSKQKIIIPGIIEHIEKAGIHSGDSTIVFPSINISKDIKSKILSVVKKIVDALNVIGFFNIQLIIAKNKIYVIEVNLRSSRTTSFISKVSKFNLPEAATNFILGKDNMDFKDGINYFENNNNKFFIKSPVFSFSKLKSSVNTSLGPEMKSTGEAIGIDTDFSKALYKSLLAAGYDILKKHTIYVTCKKNQRNDLFLKAIKNFSEVNYQIYATDGTAKFLKENKIEATSVKKIGYSKKIINLINKNELSFIINISDFSSNSHIDFEKIKHFAILKNIPIFSNLELATAVSNLCRFIKYDIRSI
ncbi:carbamoyl-phosphate synthase large subunit [symbiont of Argiope bruennichi]|uniref:carbamoyl-phosphate synthase large subunit n=1 Tax=symbiont of Argiope bruennichi TaxID=2810479 RepID=UPI003DA6621F